MEIRLERTTCAKEHTISKLSINGMPMGSMIEPVVIEKAEIGQMCAIGEGTYEVKVVNNPKSGTPTIKVYGKYIQHNIALRSLPSKSVTNASPSFWNEDMNEEQNIRRWSELLSMLMDSQEHHTLTIVRSPT